MLTSVPPDSGSTIISSEPVAKSKVSPAARVTIRRLEYPHPADSGVMSRSNPSAALDPDGTKSEEFLVVAVPRRHARHRTIETAVSTAPATSSSCG